MTIRIAVLAAAFSLVLAVSLVLASCEQRASVDLRFLVTVEETSYGRLYILHDTKTGACWVRYLGGLAEAPSEVCQ